MSNQFFINVLRDPPTAEQLAAAQSYASKTKEEGFAKQRRHRRITVAAWVCVIVPTVLWASAPVGSAILVIATAIAMAYWSSATFNWDGLEDLDFAPCDHSMARYVVEAIKLDPRVDAYRLAVVRQARPMTMIEGRAFERWLTIGFDAEQRMAQLRSSEPLALTETAQ